MVERRASEALKWGPIQIGACPHLASLRPPPSVVCSGGQGWGIRAGPVELSGEGVGMRLEHLQFGGASPLPGVARAPWTLRPSRPWPRGRTWGEGGAISFPLYLTSPPFLLSRSLDLTGPLLLGGVPDLPESFPVRTRHFVGCMRNLQVDSRHVDMADFIANNGTVPGMGAWVWRRPGATGREEELCLLWGHLHAGSPSPLQPLP